MDVRLSRAGIHKQQDPHGRNNWETYKHIHETRLANHEFVDPGKPHTIEYDESQSGLIVIQGRIYCQQDVVLEVEKLLEVSLVNGNRWVRGVRYRYVAWIPRGRGRSATPILRYHNVHERDDDYHHRVFDPRTGQQMGYEKLTRFQFPVLSEVIDEIALILELYPQPQRGFRRA